MQVSKIGEFSISSIPTNLCNKTRFKDSSFGGVTKSTIKDIKEKSTFLEPQQPSTQQPSTYLSQEEIQKLFKLGIKVDPQCSTPILARQYRILIERYKTQNPDQP